VWKVGDIVVLKSGQREELRVWTPEYWKGVGLDEPLKVLAVDVVSGGVHVRVACLRNGLPIQVGNCVGQWLASRFESYTGSASAQVQEKCASTSKTTPRSYNGLSWHDVKRINCLVVALRNHVCWNHTEWPTHLVKSEEYRRDMITHALGRTNGKGTESMDGLRVAIEEVGGQSAPNASRAAKLEPLLRDHECWEHPNWGWLADIDTPEKQAYQIGVALELLDAPEIFPDSEYGAIRAAIYEVESGDIFGTSDRCAYCRGVTTLASPVEQTNFLGGPAVWRHHVCSIRLTTGSPWPHPEFPTMIWSHDDVIRGVLRARKILRDKAKPYVARAQPAAVVFPPVAKPVRCTVHGCAHRIEDERDGRAMCFLHAVKYDAWLGEQHANGIKAEVEPKAAWHGEPRILNNADVSSNPWNRRGGL